MNVCVSICSRASGLTSLKLHYHIFWGKVVLPLHFEFLNFTVVVMPKFDFKEYLSTIKQYKVNHLS